MTTEIYVIIIIFVVMMFFPLVASSAGLRKPSKEALLEVRQDKSRDPRYFGVSFASMMEKGLKSYDGSGKIKLSRLSDLIEADKQMLPRVCEAIVYSRGSFAPPAGFVFEKEIYCEQDATLISIPRLRTIYAKGPVTLGAGTILSRWVDSEETVTVYDHCDLGISATSKERLIVGMDIAFRRLYAPVIHLGAELSGGAVPLEKEPAKSSQAYNEPVFRDVEFVDESLSEDESRVVAGTVISKKAVAVLENIRLMGHIRSHESVTIHNKACVHGNIFAEGDVYIGRGACVYGNILTQGNLIVERDAYLGQYGEIKSVIARGEIIFNENCRAHGYISSEQRGLCCPDASKLLGYDDYAKKLQMPDELTPQAVLPAAKFAVYAKAWDFDNANEHMFRKSRQLQRIVIPEGVTYIRKSFFYKCENLRSVSLPSTLEHIDDYAFCGCTLLEDIDLSGCAALARIGEHAFEGCKSLTSVRLPDGLYWLESAAFYGCEKLHTFSFGSGSALETLPGHAFYGCAALTGIALPGSLRSVGTSAFYGCVSITELHIPSGVDAIGGYAFFGCKSLKLLRIDSAKLAPQRNILSGLPDSVIMQFKNSDLAAALNIQPRRAD